MASRLVRANAVTAGDVLDGHALLAIFDAVAALLWGLYASLLGYLGLECVRECSLERAPARARDRLRGDG